MGLDDIRIKGVRMLSVCAVIPDTENWTFKATATVNHSYILVSFPWVSSSEESSLPLRRRYGKGTTDFIILLCIKRWNGFLSSASNESRTSWIWGNKELYNPVTSSTPLKSDLNFCRLGRLSALYWPSLSCTVIFLWQQCTAHGSQRKSPPWVNLNAIFVLSRLCSYLCSHGHVIVDRHKPNDKFVIRTQGGTK